MTTPFLKWVGGKRALLDTLIPLLPASFDTYHEPFVGGGALFFALHDLGRIKHAVLSDMNAALITTYTAVRDDVDGLIDRLSALAGTHHETQYYAMRASAPTHATDIAARFIYLNKTCYNGLWRVNKSGAFNVPMGRYKNPAICDADTLRAASCALQNVELHCRPFDAGTPAANDFLYFDPPYAPLNAASFTRYAAGDFGADDQTRLRDYAAALAARGVFAMLSNADVPFIRDAYAHNPFHLHTALVPRFVNSKASARGPVAEVIVTTYDTATHAATAA